MGIKGFGRITNWISLDNFTATAINNEFNNLFVNLGAGELSGASGDPATLSGMRATEDPGTQGAENLPSTIEDDIKQIRFVLDEIIGETYWYDQPDTNLAEISNLLVGITGSQKTRIISGPVAFDGYNTPAFMQPNGTTASVTMLSPMLVSINSVNYSFDSNLVLTGLAAAPSTTNTATVKDALLIGQQASLTQGQGSTVLQITGAGTNFAARSGQYCAFKVGTEVFIGQLVLDNQTGSATFTNASPTVVTVANHGLLNNEQITFSGGSLPAAVVAGTSYFVTVIDANTFKIAATVGGSFINTAGTGSGTMQYLKSNRIQNCFRGWFVDSTLTAIARAPVSNGDTITMLQLSWIFASNKSGIEGLSVTYNRPTAASSAPTSASIGDYYYNTDSQSWFQYSGTSWISAEAVLVGLAVQDTTKTIAARSFDFSLSFSSLNTIEAKNIVNVIRSTNLSCQISVYGSIVKHDYDFFTWESGSAFAASSNYYCYVGPLGQVEISLVAPTDRRYDLLGFYHPITTQRCAVGFSTDVSGNVDPFSVSFSQYNQSVLPDYFVSGRKLKAGAVDLQMAVFTSSGTWLVPQGITTAEITVVAGGGGGGGSQTTGANQGSDPGGGGGGGWAIRRVSTLVPGTTVTVTVGAGGTAGAVGGSGTGGTGGSSSFGTYATATGGTGGSGCPVVSNQFSAPGGIGGIGSSGDINARGGDGGNGFIAVGTSAIAGSGGESLFAGRKSPVVGTSAAGYVYGGGGAGGSIAQSTSQIVGGVGAQGIVIVKWIAPNSSSTAQTI